MAKPQRPWTVLSPEPFDKLTPHLWRLEDVVPDLPLKRVMTCAKRSDNKLVIYNPVCLPEAQLSELTAWGEVSYIIVPNGFHRLDAAAWQQRFSAATMLAPSGSLSKVAEVVQCGSLYNYPNDSIVTLSTIDGTRELEAFMKVKEPASGEISIVVCDAIFNMPHLRGVKGFILKHLTQSSGGPKTSRVARFVLLKDKPAFKTQLTTWAKEKDLRRVIVGHHIPIDTDVSATLEGIAEQL